MLLFQRAKKELLAHRFFSINDPVSGCTLDLQTTFCPTTNLDINSSQRRIILLFKLLFPVSAIFTVGVHLYLGGNNDWFYFVTFTNWAMLTTTFYSVTPSGTMLATNNVILFQRSYNTI